MGSRIVSGEPGREDAQSLTHRPVNAQMEERGMDVSWCSAWRHMRHAIRVGAILCLTTVALTGLARANQDPPGDDQEPAPPEGMEVPESVYSLAPADQDYASDDQEPVVRKMVVEGEEFIGSEIISQWDCVGDRCPPFEIKDKYFVRECFGVKLRPECTPESGTFLWEVLVKNTNWVVPNNLDEVCLDSLSPDGRRLSHCFKDTWFLPREEWKFCVGRSTATVGDWYGKWTVEDEGGKCWCTLNCSTPCRSNGQCDRCETCERGSCLPVRCDPPECYECDNNHGCRRKPHCGDRDCNCGETKRSCCEDCADCGDGECNAPCENRDNCCEDCAECCDNRQCGPCHTCDRGSCVPVNCPRPCEECNNNHGCKETPHCGDGECNCGETPQSCPKDCERGACCLRDDSCKPNQTEQECLNQGGEFKGGACSPDPCEEGACCFDDGCKLRTERECLDQGGDFIGGDCDPDPCEELGACCLPDGSCKPDQPKQECEDEGGEWKEGDCDPDPCDPLGACCLPDETCEDDLTEQECADKEGVKWHEGKKCDEVECKTGACCLSDGSCEDDLTEEQCTDTKYSVKWHKAQACDEVECPVTCNGNENITKRKCKTERGQVKKLLVVVKKCTPGQEYTGTLDSGEKVKNKPAKPNGTVKFKFKRGNKPPCGPNGVTASTGGENCVKRFFNCDC